MLYKMVRQYRQTNTPITPAITDPILLRQMTDTTPIEGIQCECGNVINACHLERHRRSKKHALSLNWVREQRYIAIAQHAQRERVTPADNTE